MSEKTLVPIFVFWAFLTIITPTLILLSENSKADDFDFNGNKTGGGFVKSRRMMDKNNMTRFRTQPALKVVAEEKIVEAPAPAPTPSSMASHSNSPFHDQTNTTEESGHYKPSSLSPENKYVKQHTTSVTSTST